MFETTVAIIDACKGFWCFIIFVCFLLERDEGKDNVFSVSYCS